VTMQQRKLQVLRAIVEDYVATNEPVGSKSISDRHGFAVSAATIRSDMAALEDAGLITQPHTSAGRIPTDAGYRLFVNELAEMQPITAPQQRAIQRFFAEAVGFDEVLTSASRLVAELTGQIAIVQYPTLKTARLKHLELVELSAGGNDGGEGRLLVVVITDSGRVAQTHLVYDQPVQIDFQSLNVALNNAAAGKSLTELPDAFAAVAVTLPADTAPLFSDIAQTIIAAIEGDAESKLVISGAANLARSGNHFDVSLLPILEALEEQVTLLSLLAEMKAEPPTADNEMRDANSVRVRIGSENRVAGFTETSLITADYGLGDYVLGNSSASHGAVIGAIGPTRLNYPATMASVRAVARYLTRVLPA